jgi:hypothetical protein
LENYELTAKDKLLFEGTSTNATQASKENSNINHDENYLLLHLLLGIILGIVLLAIFINIINHFKQTSNTRLQKRKKNQ